MGLVDQLDEIVAFSARPKLASEIACLGLMREIGTVNDEIARFLFDAETGEVVDRSTLKAEPVKWQGFNGLRIFSTQTQFFELRVHGLHDLIHPTLSYEKGRLTQLVIFPEIIAMIAAKEGLELVIVKQWAMNTIFGGFDPKKAYYQTNFWELENNDSLLFADLLRKRQVAFLGTHDLIAHIANTRASAWPLLSQQAEQVYRALNDYFGENKKSSIAAMVLPYTIGVVLDDLAQPPSYGSASHSLVLDFLLQALSKKEIAPELPMVLQIFPKNFEKIIQLSRRSETERIEVEEAVVGMIGEILRFSIIHR